MTRLDILRIALAAIGIAVWGYGYRVGDSHVTLGGMIILAVALVLRFVPRRWFGGTDGARHDR